LSESEKLGNNTITKDLMYTPEMCRYTAL